jgi:hypothetical protein
MVTVIRSRQSRNRSRSPSRTGVHGPSRRGSGDCVLVNAFLHGAADPVPITRSATTRTLVVVHVELLRTAGAILGNAPTLTIRGRTVQL